MKIQTTNFVVYSKSTNFKDLLQNKKKKNINFRARPWDLPYIPVYGSNEAINLYNYFKLGNYLDSSDDDVTSENKKIRTSNLGFLDAIYTQKDKKDFIEYYKLITGFPNLEKVSINIEKEFINAIYKSANGLQGGECIAAGYDETCSVGKRLAFPGSDLDKSFIVLKGDSSRDEEKDKKIVDQFKGRMWKNVDQRILSFNHDISFPNVYTENQIRKIFKIIDDKTQNIYFDKLTLEKIMDKEIWDLEKASQFNIKIAQNFPTDDGSKKQGLTKTDVKDFGYFVESLRDGKYLIYTLDFEFLKNDIQKSQFYQYSNTAQIKAIKKTLNDGTQDKTKIKLRKDITKQFNNWSIDEQYNFIKTLIKYSCEDNTEYMKYFKNDRDIREAYKPLLNLLTWGDKKIYNRPEFIKTPSSLQMKYADDATVSLYRGYAENVLWIDSNDSTAIKQVCRNIGKIKECELFKKIDRIQCKAPYEYIYGFYPIQFKTGNNETIYERMINEN